MGCEMGGEEAIRDEKRGRRINVIERGRMRWRKQILTQRKGAGTKVAEENEEEEE